MALNPVNYSIQSLDPIQGYQEGLKNNAQIGVLNAQANAQNTQAQIALQEQALKQQQADQEQALRQQQQQSIQNLYNKFSQGNASTQDVLNASLFLPKDQTESIIKAWDLRDTDQKKNLLTTSGSYFTALNNNNLDLAKQIGTNAKLAYEKAGDTANAKAIGDLMQLTEIDPNVAKTNIATLIAQLPEGKAVLENALGKPQADIAKIKAETAQAEAITQGKKIENLYAPQNLGLKTQETQSNIAKNQAETQNVYSQIQERNNNFTQPKLSAESEKLINDSVQRVNSNNATIGNIQNIQNRFDVLKQQTGGFVSSAGNWLEQTFGSNSELQNLRTQIAQVNFDKLKANKLGGATSDADLKFLQSTVISPTSDPDVIERYLSTAKKVLDTENRITQNQSDWVSAVGNLGTSRRDVEINGLLIPKGTKFSDFNRAFGSSKSYLKY